MSTATEISPEHLDLATCDSEPIHIPGSIQPHGVLFSLKDDGTGIILQVSDSIEKWLGFKAEGVVGRGLSHVLGSLEANHILGRIKALSVSNNPIFVDTILQKSQLFQVIAHRYAGLLNIELETTEERESDIIAPLFPMLGDFVPRLHQSHSVREAGDAVVRTIRELTGFDRVLVYRFDPDWNGQTLAEDRDSALQPYLDLWFPASDIPRQARELYRLNRTRLIVNSTYRPSLLVPEVNPQTGTTPDLTYSVLRSVSPVHLEYLRNMGVAASMSFSIVTEGKLWGLISCHHRTPRSTSYAIRAACDFATQIFAGIVSSLERRADYEQRIELKSIMTRLLAYMAEEDHFIEGLKRWPGELLAFADANGAAIVWEDKVDLVGATPSAEQVSELTEWLVKQGREDVFHTACAGSENAAFEAFTDLGSGILAVSISKLYRGYVIWFRPEVIQTVNWGGDPRKALEQQQQDIPARLHPRKSFEAWKEIVRGQSRPWSASQVDTALELRNAMVGIVLRKAEELGQLSAELQRSNRELEAFSYSVSHDLRAPFRHVVGYAEMLRDHLNEKLDEKSTRYIGTIIESAEFAGSLVDNLLNFSRIGRSRLNVSQVNMARLVKETIADFDLDLRGRNVLWNIPVLPVVHGDLMMLRTAWQNLISNALKYSRAREQAVITIASEETDSEWIFSVKDNGVGFDPRYSDKLFGVFQRLHKMEDYEGTGIGLANLRRIAARHGGRTWADSKPGEGATFCFSISKRLPKRAA